MRFYLARRLVAFGLVATWVVEGPPLACAASLVSVNATAISQYVRPVDVRGQPRAESYVFTEGKYFGGRTLDTSLKRTGFEEIIRVLAPALAKQNYFPTKEVPAANLLLMVHW